MPPTTISKDRRSNNRYPINLSVTFKVMKKGVVVSAGTGTVVNISSGGVAFTSECSFRAGMSISLRINWPVLLEGNTRIMLVADGTIVRWEGKVVAVQIVRHAFHTKRTD
jgi:PilZ domain